MKIKHNLKTSNKKKFNDTHRESEQLIQQIVNEYQ